MVQYTQNIRFENLERKNPLVDRFILKSYQRLQWKNDKISATRWILNIFWFSRRYNHMNQATRRICFSIIKDYVLSVKLNGIKTTLKKFECIFFRQNET